MLALYTFQLSPTQKKITMIGNNDENATVFIRPVHLKNKQDYKESSPRGVLNAGYAPKEYKKRSGPI